MPQTTYYPLYAASYPILAKAQKPGGVTVLATVTGGDVPNKPTPYTATIQMASVLSQEPEPEAEVSGEHPVEETEQASS